MFIKLTKTDNRPIWLNASFIVTVEPRKEGTGAIVVPIGDGLDYEVRESVDEVLAKLADAPAATVVPVPAPDCLGNSPNLVSRKPVAPAEEPYTVANVKSAEPVAAPAEMASAESAVPERKTRKRTTRKTSTAKETTSKAKKAAASASEKAEVPAQAEDAAPAPHEEPAAAKPDARLELSDDQIVRLAKMAPKSVGKLKNTLLTQFHVADVGETVLLLAAKGVFTLDGARVLWS